MMKEKVELNGKQKLPVHEQRIGQMSLLHRSRRQLRKLANPSFREWFQLRDEIWHENLVLRCLNRHCTENYHVKNRVRDS
jgi:hypothetical protein